MKIALLAFASVSDALGERESVVALQEGSSIADLKTLLEVEHPELRAMWEGLAVAVNGNLETDDRILQADDEVALLPPVSGGSALALALTEDPIPIEEVAARVEDPGCGAVILFLGNVRNSHQGHPVEGITYSAYRPMAEARLRQIEDELAAQNESTRVAIVHRLGRLQVGDTSVVIGVSAPHRALAYDLNRRALERLKSEVPIWKKEHYADGQECWREEEPLTANRAGTLFRS